MSRSSTRTEQLCSRPSPLSTTKTSVRPNPVPHPPPPPPPSNHVSAPSLTPAPTVEQLDGNSANTLLKHVEGERAGEARANHNGQQLPASHVSTTSLRGGGHPTLTSTPNPRYIYSALSFADPPTPEGPDATPAALATAEQEQKKRSASLLKWHASVLTKTGPGSVMRVMTDRKRV